MEVAGRPGPAGGEFFTCPTNSYTSWSIWEKSNGGGMVCAHAVPTDPTTGNIARSKRQRCIRLERMENLLWMALRQGRAHDSSEPEGAQCRPDGDCLKFV